MASNDDIAPQVGHLKDVLRRRLHATGPTLGRTLRRVRHRLSGRAYRAGQRVAAVEPMLAHPKLARTIDRSRLGRDAARIEADLAAMDLADQRKGWWLGLLGGLVFNLLAFFALLIGVLVWRGFL